MSTIENLVSELSLPDKRENAAKELFKKRDRFPEIGRLLWHSPATIAAFINRIQSIYCKLSPPTLTQSDSLQVGSILNLLQCVVPCQDTRALFLRAQIPCYLYPFLNTTTKTPPFEYLRLSSLGVLKALVQHNGPEGVKFLVAMHANHMDIVRPCLRIMTTGVVLSKRVATYVLMKIVQHNAGLAYIHARSNKDLSDANPEVIANILYLMLAEHTTAPIHPHLLKCILRCYSGLCNDIKARETLWCWHPNVLRKITFEVYLRGDVTTQNLLDNLRKFVENSTHPGAL